MMIHNITASYIKHTFPFLWSQGTADQAQRTAAAHAAALPPLMAEYVARAPS
jgi:hypothetical protein